uniref:C-type lectin domain-containing protein n=1 Tax=Elaeophora elaphi TaxID=1147741 RepID=A0A0R3RMJ4_9BILA
KTNEQCAIDEICVVGGYCVPDPHSEHGTGIINLLRALPNDFLSDIYNAGGNGTYWIGLLKDINGIFKWQSGESIIYTNWDNGEPEPRIGCVIANVMDRNGKCQLLFKSFVDHFFDFSSNKIFEK